MNIKQLTSREGCTGVLHQGSDGEGGVGGREGHLVDVEWNPLLHQVVEHLDEVILKQFAGRHRVVLHCRAGDYVVCSLPRVEYANEVAPLHVDRVLEVHGSLPDRSRGKDGFSDQGEFRVRALPPHPHQCHPCWDQAVVLPSQNTAIAREGIVDEEVGPVGTVPGEVIRSPANISRACYLL